MLKQVIKKKEKQQVPFVYKGTVCGECKYERKITDLNPEWQCPCCKSAYSKVNVSNETKQAHLNKMNAAHRKKKNDEIMARRRKTKQSSAGALGSVGLVTLLHGLGTSCTCTCANLYSKASSNPWLLALGGVILVGALVFGLSSLSQ